MPKQVIPYTMSELGFGLSNGPVNFAWRSTLRVILTVGDRRVECYGIVDSGADFTSFPLLLADTLGLTLSGKATTSTGTGAETATWFHPITIELPDILGASPFSVNVGFVEGLNKWFSNGVGVGLLGQNGFFDKFRACFDFGKKSFEIEPLEPAWADQK